MIKDNHSNSEKQTVDPFVLKTSVTEYLAAKYHIDNKRAKAEQKCAEAGQKRPPHG